MSHSMSHILSSPFSLEYGFCLLDQLKYAFSATSSYSSLPAKATPSWSTKRSSRQNSNYECREGKTCASRLCAFSVASTLRGDTSFFYMRRDHRRLLMCETALACLNMLRGSQCCPCFSLPFGLFSRPCPRSICPRPRCKR